MTVVFYKPCGVVSQFSPLAGHRTLADFGLPIGMHPVASKEKSYGQKP